MELRRQEKDINSITYTPPILSSPLEERRRNDPSCLSPILSPNHSLDQHNNHPQLNLHDHHQVINNPTSDPDRAPCSGAGATIAAASNSRTTRHDQQLPPTNSNSGAETRTPIRYRECLKNHAATMGGHVLDGCGEFMPNGDEGTPEALRCAACDCHRNFHRKEIDGEPSQAAGAICYYPYINNARNNTVNNTNIHHMSGSSLLQSRHQPPNALPTMLPHQQQHHKYTHNYSHGVVTSPPRAPLPPMMMAFGGSSGAPEESSSEDLNMFPADGGGAQAVMQTSFSISKKRFRTKFTQQQKDRMYEFAEKLGWKMQKQDDNEVQQFCNDVGVKRQVFKVWMHNNKQAIKKKQT